MHGFRVGSANPPLVTPATKTEQALSPANVPGFGNFCESWSPPRSQIRAVNRAIGSSGTQRARVGATIHLGHADHLVHRRIWKSRQTVPGSDMRGIAFARRPASRSRNWHAHRPVRSTAWGTDGAKPCLRSPIDLEQLLR